jgi:hypothetical protein
MQKIFVSFNKRVFIALIMGLGIGVFLQYFDIVQNSSNIIIYNILGNGYTRLLRMILFPVIIVATLSAIIKLSDNNNSVKSVILFSLILLLTTTIAAIIAVITANIFNLDFSTLLGKNVDNNILNNLNTRLNTYNRPLDQMITDFIPTNPFLDLTGVRANSIPAVVVFCLFVGIAYLGVYKKEQQIALKFKNAIDVAYKIVMRLVVIILRLTPYGILGLMVQITALSKFNELLSLINFIGINYIAIIIMFIIHFILISIFGFNPLTYIKKLLALLIFAFTSRSSSAAIPLNISTQTDKLGINSALASISSSFGSIMGQNGCAGIYPVLLAIASASFVGINPMDISFIITLIFIAVVSSIGVAGVGGGATFASIAVLTYFNMPLTIVALLVAIDPIIDMGRTTLNVNGTVISSLISAKITKNIDTTIYNNKDNTNETM